MKMTEERKKLQRVVCAANRMPDGFMFIGARHWDMHMHQQADNYKQVGGTKENSLVKAEQGFIDQFGNFLTREEAWEIARRQGQIIRECSDPIDCEDGMLFSENLY